MSEEVISPLLTPSVELKTEEDALLAHYSYSSSGVRTSGIRSYGLSSASATGQRNTAGGGTMTFSSSDEKIERKSSTTNGFHSGQQNGQQNPTETDKNSSNFSQDMGSSKRSFAVLGLVFVISILLLWWVYSTFPQLDSDEKQHIKLPRSIEDAKMLGSVLNRYKDKYYREVLCGVFVVYIFLQTFAIPGSIFLSILSGFLFPFWIALLLVCFCSATGASFCYGLSLLVGRRLIYKYFPEKVQAWSLVVNQHRDNLLNYIIFLRITPFLPNWFINITAPVIGVPLFPFWIGTFMGVAPPSFVAIQAGTTLNQLTSSADALSWTSLIVLIGLGGLSLIPVLMKDRLKRKFD